MPPKRLLSIIFKRYLHDRKLPEVTSDNIKIPKLKSSQDSPRKFDYNLQLKSNNKNKNKKNKEIKEQHL